MRNTIQKYYEDLPTLNIVKLYYANFIYIGISWQNALYNTIFYKLKHIKVYYKLYKHKQLIN